MKICVFCSSSNSISNNYFDLAEELGLLIGKNNHTLIHGGGMIGLMGKIADSVQKNGGKTIGIIPQRLNLKGIIREKDDEIIITPDMHERKNKMTNLADAFVVLPGGFGTFDELFEELTLKQLGYHTKPVIIVNSGNFFDNILKQFDVIYHEKFAKESFKNLYTVVVSPTEIFTFLGNYNFTLTDKKY